MSLGAVDFGLLVDGAVIIIENAVRRLVRAAARDRRARSLAEDERARRSCSDATLEVRAASVFGEAIIAIVYLPILALTGTEGKLFRPMATTVLLALGGARLLLTLTVVPVLASYVVRPAPRRAPRDVRCCRFRAHSVLRAHARSRRAIAPPLA